MSDIERRPGLREVIAGETQICNLDEQASKVYIHGYPLEELVEKHTYEETAYLTLFGEMPSASSGFRAPDEALLRKLWATLGTEPREAHPMGLLRTAMSATATR